MALSPQEFQKLKAQLAARKSVTGAPTQFTPEEPGVFDRVSDVVTNAGTQAQEAIAGEDEFAGRSDIRRGVDAVAEVATAVPEVALELSPKPVRDTVRGIGDFIGKGFEKLTNFIGDTALFKGAAGSLVVGKDGTYQFVPADTELLEEGLGVAAPLGETAGTILGAKGAAATTQTVARAGGNAASSAASAAQTAANTVASTVRPAADVARGLTTKVSDFAVRTGREAIDTAEESRRLSTMPESDARLVRSGADERVLNLVRNSTPEERNVYRDLVGAAKNKEADLEAPQPKVLAGQEFMKPVDHLLRKRDEVGNQLGTVRQKLSNASNIDINRQFRAFQRYLTETLGLRIDKNGNLIKGQGRIADSDLREVQKIYNELRPEKLGSARKSQRWIDEYLQRTFKEYDLRQAREQTFSDDVTRVAEQARTLLRQAMPEEYNALSTQYATVMKPIQDVVKLLGYKGDLEKLSAKELKAAEVALRVLGNAADRPQSVIDDVLRVANETGYSSDVDLNRVLLITDQLEDLYDITPSRGFSGSTARGVDQSAVGTLGDVATMNFASLFGRALNSKASRKEVQEAFEEFLNSLD